MKFFISLGPNCEDASVNATSVTEKTVPATPIIAPDIVDKIILAESELFTKKNRIKLLREILIHPSIYTRPIDNNIDIMTRTEGINQNVAFNFFHLKINLFIHSVISFCNFCTTGRTTEFQLAQILPF